MAMRSNEPKGFTLIEVIAALAIVSTALLGLLQLHLVSLRTADKAQVITQAVLLAQEKMADVLCCGYPPLGANSGVVEANGSELAWRTEVTDERVLPGGRSDLRPHDLRKVAVDVSLQKDPGGKTIHLTTYMAKSGIREAK